MNEGVLKFLQAYLCVSFWGRSPKNLFFDLGRKNMRFFAGYRMTSYPFSDAYHSTFLCHSEAVRPKNLILNYIKTANFSSQGVKDNYKRLINITLNSLLYSLNESRNLLKRYAFSCLLIKHNSNSWIWLDLTQLLTKRL